MATESGTDVRDGTVRHSGPLAIEARDLRKAYDAVKAVNGISFEVREGEIFGLLGPNGAGKTTTIEMLEGMRRPDSGDVRLFGADPTRHSSGTKERIGIALQTSSLYPRLKVVEILQLFGTFYARAVEPESLIALVGLQEKRDTQTRNLSGGQRQRLALALALVHNPDLLFLDEPTAGLDPQSRRVLWDVVERLRATGKTVLLTTHYMDEAEYLCDRVAIVDHGKIIALDAPADLIRTYLPQETISFDIAGAFDPTTLSSIPSVTSVDSETADEGTNRIRVTAGDAQAAIRAILTAAEAKGVQLRNLSLQSASLEDVFLMLTGRRIRD